GWTFQGDWDETTPIISNTCTLEWPPLSGKFITFPEIDRARFFSLRRAREKIKQTQQPFLDRLAAALKKRDAAGVRT
ncbi:MAG: NUDIX hydrolase, partial [Verrucomicrobiota bacterium]